MQHLKKLIHKNNQLFKKSKPHIYRIQDKVIMHNKKSNKYEDLYTGPYTITHLWININFTIHQVAVHLLINIIWIKPCHK